MCNVKTDVDRINSLYGDYPPECKIFHSLKLVDYLHLQADYPWYNYNWPAQFVSLFLSQFSLGF